MIALSKMWTSTALLSFVSAIALAQITTCPTTEISYSTNGSIYKICPQSDYSGMTSNAIAEVASINACTDLCDKRTGCKNAVYNYQARMCFLKSGQLQWISKVGADSVRFDKTITNVQPPLISCPATETSKTTAQGVTYKFCANTDFARETSNLVAYVANAEACAALCDGIATCFKAVYNKAYSICHSKAGNVALVTSTQADTVQLVRGVSDAPGDTPSSSRASSSTPTSVSTFTRTPSSAPSSSFTGFPL